MLVRPCDGVLQVYTIVPYLIWTRQVQTAKPYLHRNWVIIGSEVSMCYLLPYYRSNANITDQEVFILLILFDVLKFFSLKIKMKTVQQQWLESKRINDFVSQITMFIKYRINT